MPVNQEQPKSLKYWALIQHLRQQIAQDSLRPGDRVPSLAEMQAQFGVSRGTVEKAYALLEQEGFLMREQGRGTFVADVTGSATPMGTGTIGLLLRTWDVQHPYILPFLEGLRVAAEQLNVDLLWMNAQNPQWDKVDGVLVYQSDVDNGLGQFPPGMPRVAVLRQAKEMSSVTADDFHGAKQATEYLLTQGHRRIACLTSSTHDSVSVQRLAGYRAAFMEMGLEPDGRWIRCLPRIPGLNYVIKGELGMRTWLHDDWRGLNCSAILAANDETAIGIVKSLQDGGLTVPDDVSVVGFDGTVVREHCTPRLTTVEVPLREIGIQAVELLSNQLQTNSIGLREIVLPVRLKLGDSTAPKI